MDQCPEIRERLTDAEISRRKRDAIAFADSTKEKGKSAIHDEAIDRNRVSTRKSFFFRVPWNND